MDGSRTAHGKRIKSKGFPKEHKRLLGVGSSACVGAAAPCALASSLL